MGAPLQQFSPATREWFAGAFAAPTQAQLGAWEAIASGSHALVVAPTGSGKTLAAFLWAIDRLASAASGVSRPSTLHSPPHGRPMLAHRPEPAAWAHQGTTSSGSGDSSKREPEQSRTDQHEIGTRVLYISPLKALGVDVERNLRSPLVGITQTARRLGVHAPNVTVGVRSGDTSSADRRMLQKRPPDILITTPESLYLMLTSAARETLRNVETVIIDEVHAVASTKRGAHLALSLERLDSLLETPAQRIGLSATVRPLEEVARYLGGRAPVTIVAPPAEKKFDLRVVVPVEDMTELGTAPIREGSAASGSAAPAQGSIWPHVEEQIVDRILEHRSTIVFANSRRLAERLTARLNEIYANRMNPLVDGGETGEFPPTAPARRMPAQIMGAVELGQSRQRLRDPSADRAREVGSGATAGVSTSSTSLSGDLLARAHHGSVSKDQRAIIEDDLKSGRLRCVVATSSLELGIDMGAVDLVIQVESPPSVASGLQRVGRAGHQIGEISRGILFPKHRADLLHSAVTAERMTAGLIERLAVPQNPLDVLAQQTVAAVALDKLDVEDWFDTVRRSAPFFSLPRSAYDATLDLLSGLYPSDEFAELRPRIIWDRVNGTITGRPGAQRLAVTSGGTIPDRGLFGVYMVGSSPSTSAGDGPSTLRSPPHGRPMLAHRPEPAALAQAQGVASSGTGGGRGGGRVGELDEEMVYESRVGDVFALGATSWRIEDITHDRVIVSPAFGHPGRVPFWKGDGIGRPAELGRAIGAFTRELSTSSADKAVMRLRATGLDELATGNLVAFIADQKAATGQVPTDRTLVVERFRDELGDWRVILHSPYGMQVHAPWALAVGARIRDRFGVDAAAMASDDGVILRIPDTDAEPPSAELFLFDPEELRELVTAEVGGSALFAARFRECAARALLLPRYNPGRRSPLWQQRQRASQLLAVAAKYPSFPIVLETVREVLQDVYDLPSLTAIAAELQSRRIRIVETETEQASPFARSLLFGYVAAFMYEGDSPLAERRAAALSLDSTLLAELLGRAELRELLDAGVIDQTELELQRLAPDRRAKGAEGIVDLLRLLGPLSVAEVGARLVSDGPSTSSGTGASSEAGASSGAGITAALDELEHAGRVLRVTISGDSRWAAIEDASRLRDALGTPLPIGVPSAFIQPVADPVGDLVARFARTHSPFTVSAVAERFALGPAVVLDTLRRLEQQRRVVEGEFRPGSSGSEWCDVEVLHRLRSRSLAALRHEVEPVDAAALGRFLPSWQHITEPLRGIDGLVQVIDQLAGVALPASAWETYVLPTRVRDYSPVMLDELTATGEVLWSGHGPLPGNDGWVSLHLAASAALTLEVGNGPSTLHSPPHGRPMLAHRPEPAAWAQTQGIASSGSETNAGADPNAENDAEDGELDPLQRAVLGVLAGGGAFFFRQLAGAVGSTDDKSLVTALWDLVWRGLVTGDTFSPLRAYLGGPARPGTHRVRAYRGRARPTLPAQAGPPTVAGRWSLLPAAETDQTVRAIATAEQLLERHGVVTRGAVVNEGIRGGFSTVYKVLSRFEESGRARRGYFIEGLGAAQFATGATIDRLRAFTRQADASPELAAVTLAATDPANPYGAALGWPKTQGTHRPGRKAGALVVLVDGDLALYIERGGKTTLTFTSDEAVLAVAASSLAAGIRRSVGKLRVERADGEFVIGTPLGTALTAAGFSTTPQGLRLRA